MRVLLGLIGAALAVVGCTAGMTAGDGPSPTPRGVTANLLDTLQRDVMVFEQPRWSFVLPAPFGIEFDSKATAAFDATGPRGGPRKTWIVRARTGEVARIQLFVATPLIARGPISAEASLRKFAASVDSLARLDPGLEVRGVVLKGEGDKTDFRITEWDKEHHWYRRERCVPSPEWRVIPVFVCAAGASVDTMTFDAVVRGLQFPDHLAFKFAASLREAMKNDTTAKRR